MKITTICGRTARQLGWKKTWRAFARKGRRAAGVAVLGGGLFFTGAASGGDILTENFESATEPPAGGGGAAGMFGGTGGDFGAYRTDQNYSGDPHSSVIDGGSFYGHTIGVASPTVTIDLGAADLNLVANGASLDFDGWFASWTGDGDFTAFSAEFFSGTGGGGVSLGSVQLASGDVEGSSTTPSGAWNADNWSRYTVQDANTIAPQTQSIAITYGGLGNDTYADNIVISVTAGTPAPVVLGITIDRDTGAVSLTNDLASPQQIKAYSILSGAGALIEANYDALADSDSNWVEFTAAGATDDLSEGHLTTGVIAASTSMPLDDGVNGAWMQYFDESDITFEYLDGSGALVQGTVAFTGTTQTLPFAQGDLDFDGDVDGDDWVVYASELGDTFADQSAAQAYRVGDFNNDGANNHADFRVFKGLFDAANGPGAFARLIAAPEPGTLTLLACAGFGLLGWRRQS